MLRVKKIKNIGSKLDLKKWVNWINDPIITQFSEQRLKKHTLISQKKFIKQKLKSKNSILYKIYHNKNFIGILEIGLINHYHKNCELMYMIGEKDLWGKGLGTKVIQHGIDIAKKLNIKKIFAGTYKKNIGSQKVLLKNKFKIEGKQKNFFKLGKKRDDRILLGFTI